MNAARLQAVTPATQAAGRAVDRTGPARIYDPYSLATRPLPTALRLFPHPKGISAAEARRITGGAVG